MNGRKAKIIRRLAHQFARTQPQPESAQMEVNRGHHCLPQIVTSRDTPRYFENALKKLTKTMSAAQMIEAAVRQ